jgi:hypothetical protein
VPGRALVGEAVASAAGDPVQALPGRGQQHGIVQALHAGGAGEGGQEPGPHDSVIDGVISAGGVASGRGGSRRGDDLVLGVATRPGAEVLYTSCADGPGSPRGFYLRYGFTDTGQVMWGENVLALDLAARG